ncbi:M28 family metallopeptidase [Winogradskyella immobilis]|uniref:M20/M25/M40 family metallo-hydrolase n=1 Tax=Winogradskyella immobilis TaxID=2816852 RepID=A0ABS8EM06_9FLAO|nr:M28 family metallopeptidase [Winogradskyella immobilis]MCC1484254.1 M20/M25/M40 family metallo-hydrolase [Winogradskyella immobilis]MCG0016346.1 M20/M25/M40 family metallo-hydrolase [Winogradskyella immobilis]
MKFYIASALLLVGSCATIRHSEKVKNLKESIVFEDKAVVKTYMNTITTDDLKTHVYEIASDKYNGRMTGEEGHNQVCDYIRSNYKSYNLKAPKSYSNYYQTISKSELPEDVKADSQNIIAYIEGAEFPDEYIIISAHSDHEGVIDGEIHYGADDNASGTAALLEMAEAFGKAAANGYRPKRSVVFLNVTAEEVGLVGSYYYTKNPVFPIENTVANLNTDMIGRVDKKHIDNENYIYLIGSNRISTELDFVTNAANDAFTNLELDYTYNAENDVNSYYTRSDHYNFALQGIPVVFFFNGEHEDYHKSTDTADKINFPLLKKRTDLIFATAWYIANAEKTMSNEIL